MIYPLSYIPSPIMTGLLLLLHLFICEKGHVSHGIHVEVRIQLLGVGSPCLPLVSWWLVQVVRLGKFPGPVSSLSSPGLGLNGGQEVWLTRAAQGMAGLTHHHLQSDLKSCQPEVFLPDTFLLQLPPGFKDFSFSQHEISGEIPINWGNILLTV